MKIDEIFDGDLFRQMQDEKMITLRFHEGYPLVIANYSDQAQYKNYWNDATLNSRGLIFERLTGNVIARPWKKFFNLGDAKAPWINFDDRVEVTDKMDGSLGILYVYDGKPSISTRGSFHSTQAGWATKVIRKVENLDLKAASLWTFMFEVVYPTNRIVVDYGGLEALVLLGCRSIVTGNVEGPGVAAALLNWQGLTTEVMPYKSINDVLAADDRVNTEGYVIRQGNHMVKWKREEYVRIHALASNLTPGKVLSLLCAGDDVEAYFAALPDELHAIAKEYRNVFIDQYTELEMEILSRWDEIPKTDSRRDSAWSIRDETHRPAYFSLLDGKSINDYIWGKVKLQNKES